MRQMAHLIARTRRRVGVAAIVLIVIGGLARAGAQSQAGGWQVPDGAHAERSPVAANPDVIARGRSTFTKYCQRCHGPRGKGDGPDGDADTPPADLTDPSRANANPEGVMFYKVWNGRKAPDMPAFKSRLTRNEIWTVVQYVKTLRGQS